MDIRNPRRLRKAIDSQRGQAALWTLTELLASTERRGGSWNTAGGFVG